jgi:hypothetical protein
MASHGADYQTGFILGYATFYVILALVIFWIVRGIFRIASRIGGRR